VKTLFAMVLALAVGAGTTGYAVGQEKKPEEKKMEKSGEMKKPGEMKKSDDMKMKSKMATGTVKSASADGLVVAGKDKGKDAEWTFAVDAKTNIKKGGKTITAADLKAGDPVTVQYAEHDGKATAQSVSVKAPSAAPKKADDKKPAAEKK
jgi:ribosomal protein S1